MAGRLSRRRLGDLCLLCSALILEGVGLFGVRTVMAAHQLEGQFNLVGETHLELPLLSENLQLGLPAENPSVIIQGGPAATAEPVYLPTETPPVQNVPPVAGLASLPTVIPISPTPEQLISEPPTPEPPSPTPTPTAIPEIEAPAIPLPATVNSTGRIVRLVIPRLGVDRAVVPLGFTKSSEGGVDWATDKLFANANRKDLIGQTITSVNPGEGGNIVLMGHNYDNGYYAWEDAFVNIKSLTPGDQIVVYTEGGGEYHYSVQLVKKVPWREENAAEAAKHFKYLGPTPSEQLTLVTCGGANVWPWQARLYVVSVPAQ
jgi:Sortase domain